MFGRVQKGGEKIFRLDLACSIRVQFCSDTYKLEKYLHKEHVTRVNEVLITFLRKYHLSVMEAKAIKLTVGIYHFEKNTWAQNCLRHVLI